MTDTRRLHRWSSDYAFIAAAIGAAVGIANIWRFTYVAGEQGGGAFVVVYLLAVLFVATPALIAEMMIGRRGGQSVVGNMRRLAAEEGISRRWRYYGLMAASTVFLVLSFYCVIAGWTLDYFRMGLTSGFRDVDGAAAQEIYAALLASPWRMMGYQAAFLALTVGTVAVGLNAGVERALGALTPTLFVLILVLLGYSMVSTDFIDGVVFLLRPNWSALDTHVVLSAVGQAFFSLGVGTGVMMTMGAYLDSDLSIARAGVIIGLADCLASVLAALAVFPIVFTSGLEPGAGPGLIFLTLPVAFAQMPGGAWIAPVFFLLLATAALTSSIAIFEAFVAWLEDYFGGRRWLLALLAGVGLWGAGLLSVFSFNAWSDVMPLAAVPILAEKTWFGLVEFLTSTLLMPLGGILVCLLAGWALPRRVSDEVAGIRSPALRALWRWLVRYLVPLAVGVVFLANLL